MEGILKKWRKSWLTGILAWFIREVWKWGKRERERKGEPGGRGGGGGRFGEEERERMINLLGFFFYYLKPNIL